MWICEGDLVRVNGYGMFGFCGFWFEDHAIEFSGLSAELPSSCCEVFHTCE